MILLLLLYTVRMKAPLGAAIVDDMARIPNGSAYYGRSITGVSGAKGETVSLQIVVSARGSDIHATKVTVSDLSAPGASISKDHIKLYKEHYVNVPPSRGIGIYHDEASNTAVGAGTYPDALIPFVDPETGKPPVAAKFSPIPFDVVAGHVQPIFVDIAIPSDAKPGDYSATYAVDTDQGASSGTFNVHVWNFQLPQKSSYDTDLHNLDWTRPAVKLVLADRLIPSGMNPQDIQPLVKSYDFDHQFLHLWSGADSRHSVMRAAPTQTDIQKILSKYPKGVRLFDEVADEVTGHAELYPQIREWARVLHRENVKVILTMPPVKELLDDPAGGPLIDVWCLLPNQFDANKDAISLARAKGATIWQYTALAPDGYSPKWLLDYAPINFRAHGLLSQSLGLTGMLYWRVDYYVGDPWVSADYGQDSARFSGEGQLIYPGASCGTVGPVGSLRMKWIRDGVYDFDYVQLAKNRGLAMQAMALVDPVAHDFHKWSKDPSRYAKLRTSLAQMIESKS